MVEDLHVSYGPVQALRGVNLKVEEGSIVSIIGANGAGKTTLLNTLSGIVKAKSGSVTFRGKPLPDKACNIIREGMAHVPEGRKIFSGFSIEENLLAGAYIVADKHLVEQRRDAMYARFPILAERTHQQAGTLSGGEHRQGPDVRPRSALARRTFLGPRAARRQSGV
jgi:branched-chain amino acid transport system ATP-binding protein